MLAKRRRNGTPRNKTLEAEPFRKSRPVKIDFRRDWISLRNGYAAGKVTRKMAPCGIALETDNVPS